MTSRQHARVRLRLPVRLRWTASLGQQTEICETRNVSRGGLLISCKEHHDEGFPLWVTFPFNAEAPEQPEVLARVMRSRAAPENGAGREEIALHFESVPLVPKPIVEKSAEKPREMLIEKALPLAQKNGLLRSAAVAIRVRPEHIPWFEEAMTTEVSAEEIRFVSHREHAAGDRMLVTFVGKDSRPWPGNGDTPAKIVKIENLPKMAAVMVTIRREIV
ncbi:MAG TPA: PilZ domain-containing protein [Candidatus Acidoferrum sp.]|nr:PilZ domain-containing protein [Candidatus Acidoferrum sp.]